MTEINEIRQQIREHFSKTEIHGVGYVKWLEAKLAALILETSKNKTNAQTTPKTPVPVNY